MGELVHTILGASGGVGREVLSKLQSTGENVRVVERTSKIEGIDTIKADLLDPEQAVEAIKGSNITYLCVGLPYSVKFWSKSWPLLMENVIKACEQTGSTLIFLDNIYMYGPPPLDVPIEETHSQEPSSKKGAIRKFVAEKLMDAIKSGRIRGNIVRAPDFYGPYAVNSMLWISFMERMLKGKRPQLFFPLGVKHTYSFTGDIGRAMIKIAMDESANGEIFHTPVGEPITLEEATGIMNDVLNNNLEVSVVPGFIKAILRIFIPALSELNEMNYQFTDAYILSDDKFRKRYPDFEVTSNEEGISQTIEAFKSRLT